MSQDYRRRNSQDLGADTGFLPGGGARFFGTKRLSKFRNKNSKNRHKMREAPKIFAPLELTLAVKVHLTQGVFRYTLI